MIKSRSNLIHISILSLSACIPQQLHGQTVVDVESDWGNSIQLLVFSKGESQPAEYHYENATDRSAQAFLYSGILERDRGEDRQVVPICVLYPDFCSDRIVSAISSEDVPSENPEWVVPICSLYPEFCQLSVSYPQRDNQLQHIANAGYSSWEEMKFLPQSNWLEKFGDNNVSETMIIVDPSLLLANQNGQVFIATSDDSELHISTFLTEDTGECFFSTIEDCPDRATLQFLYNDNEFIDPWAKLASENNMNTSVSKVVPSDSKIQAYGINIENAYVATGSDR